ncbi:MAG: hypothetical protein GY902_11035, partial [Planctomycetes bacterium]|nr:hypothetical protein [Planctomycetota bacterium]
GGKKRKEGEEPKSGTDANALPGTKGKKGGGKGRGGKGGKGKTKKSGKGLTANWSAAKKAATPCMFEVKAKGSCKVTSCAFCHDDAIVAAERQRRAQLVAKGGKAGGPPPKKNAVVAIIAGASLVLGGNSCPIRDSSNEAAEYSLHFARDTPSHYFDAELMTHSDDSNNVANSIHRHFGTHGDHCNHNHGNSSNYTQQQHCSALAPGELCGMTAVCCQDNARPFESPEAAASRAPLNALPGQVTYTVERISDSGAAEPLGSIAALEAQGVTGIKHLVAKTSNPITFATGAKVTTGDKTLGVQSDLTGSENLYLLSKSCPLVSSQGQTVLKERKPYVWHPDLNDGKPMFFTDPAAVEITIKDHSKVHSASRVTNYTPYFVETISFSNGMVGGVDGEVDEVPDDLEMSSCDEEESPAADAQASPSESTKKVADGAGDGELDPTLYPEGELFVPPPPDPHGESRPPRKVGSLIKRLSDEEAKSIAAAV